MNSNQNSLPSGEVAVVSIIMGSTSDLPVMEKAMKFLDDMEIPFEEIPVEEPIEDESDDDEHGLYTYANEYKIDGVFGQIFVSSNLKDFVEMVKDDFENVFS